MNTEDGNSTHWHRISPLSIVFFILSIIRQLGLQTLPALFVLMAAASRGEGGLEWLGPALSAGATVLLGYGVLSYLRFRFRVTNDRILLRKGVLNREELSIEFDRIQNISIREPFYMRPFNLSVLAIDTAGSSGKEISLAGVAKGLALDIRNNILAQAKSMPDADVQADEPETSASQLLTLQRKDVLIYGLTANFMLWAALAIGAIFGSGEPERNLGWIVQRPELQAAIEAIKSEGGTPLLAAAFSAMILLVVLLLPVISMLGALFRYDGFELTRSGDTFRKSSGLLTRHDESIRQHKIQALVWKQNAIARWFGRINLQLRQASAGTGIEDGNLPGGAKSQFMVPALLPAQAVGLSKLFLPGSEPQNHELSGINRGRYVRVHMGWSMMPPTLVFGTLGTLLNPLFFAGIAVFALLFYLVFNRIARQFAWALEGEFAYFRQGFIGSNTTIFPLHKVQRIDLQQTPSQRRKGLAYLRVHLASHSLSMPYMKVGDAARFRDLAMFFAESTRKRWF